VGDLDADGGMDVVMGEEDGTLHVFLGAGAAFVPAAVVRPRSELIGCTVYGIALADLDGKPGAEVVVSYAGDDAACASAGGVQAYRWQQIRPQN
jgi:hypothetical protein